MSEIATIIIGLDPVLLRVGPLAIHWYGLLYALGIALGLWVVYPYAADRGISGDNLWTLVWGVGIAALIGGRLYYVAQNDPAYYLSHPQHLLATWEGGMAFYGAVFLGTPALILICWQRRISIGAALDSVALLAPLAQAVGRIGNLINGDIVGYPSTLPWAIQYTNPHSFAAHGVAYQPAAAYELLFSLALFAVLWSQRKRVEHAGQLFVTYLLLYSLGQLVLFAWRDNPIVALGLKQAQLTALVVIVVITPVAWWLSRQPANPRMTGQPGSSP